MAITVNTNIPSLTAQKSLNKATNAMNTAMERMSTGYKINSSKDDAAGLAVATNLAYKASSFKVAQDNAQMGQSMLDTTEGVLDVIKDNLTRVRDLTEQAANGTYGSDALTAINSEISARLDEIDRVAQSADFNGKVLLNGDATKGGITENIQLQVGIGKEGSNSTIEVSKDLFKDAKSSTILDGAFVYNKTDSSGNTIKDDETARKFLKNVDSAIKEITSRKTTIGGLQARISSAMDTANVMQTNLTSAASLIQDADVAEESSNYIKQQILQQTSASLLATANQAPSIASSLI
jgi:flagellin